MGPMPMPPMVHPVPEGGTGLVGWIIVLCILVPLGSAAWDYFKKEWKDEI
jgi:hypothetical protein